MKKVNYLAVLLTGIFIGLSSTIMYMEHITKPIRLYFVQGNRNEKFAVQDRRGCITFLSLEKKLLQSEDSKKEAIKRIKEQKIDPNKPKNKLKFPDYEKYNSIESAYAQSVD